MAVGTNTGGQLNLYLFELGFRTTDPETGLTTVQTVAVHPLLTAPSHVQYTDQSRAAIQEVLDGSHVVHGGRANRVCNMQGTFGTENRGMGIYVGTGAVRAKRFYNEIVRLGEALSREQVDRAIDLLTGSPGIEQLMATFDPDRSVPFVNFYDFWDGISFECVVRNYRWDRAARQGATGRIDYQMMLNEVGPIAQSGVAQTLLEPLLNGLTLWQSVNGVIESYTIEGVALAAAPAINVTASLLADSLESFLAHKDAATALMGSGRRTELLLDFFENAEQIRSAAMAIAGTYKPKPAVQQVGVFQWDGADTGIDTITEYQESGDLSDVASAAAFQPVVGVFFGMSPDAYQQFLTGGGQEGTLGPTVSGALIHKVTDTDTPVSIADRYGTDWGTILQANQLYPREALARGRELVIPRVRARGDLQIDGLPTFGSHQGRAAWGTDLGLELPVDEKGDLALVDGEDILVQGVTVLMEGFLESVVRGSDSLADVFTPTYIAERYARVLLSDQRVAGVADVTVESQSTGYEVAATITAINGGSIRAGA